MLRVNPFENQKPTIMNLTMEEWDSVYRLYVKRNNQQPKDFMALNRFWVAIKPQSPVACFKYAKEYTEIKDEPADAKGLFIKFIEDM